MHIVPGRMELYVSPDSLGSSFRPTQTELYSREYVINKMQKGQYNNTYFYMVLFIAFIIYWPTLTQCANSKYSYSDH